MITTPLALLFSADNTPKQDTTKLGITSPTVADGPGMLFISGLPYHLPGSQVLELC